MSDIIANLRNLHSNISDDVWPDGWDKTCPKCGKVYNISKAQCAYYLAHGGWPKRCPDCERGKDNE